MTASQLKQLEELFHSRLVTACKTSKLLGYNPARMEALLQRKPGVAIARKSVVSGDLHDGLKNMKNRLSRPDLTIEAIMQEPQFKPLFTAAEIAAAKWRLQAA